MNKFIMKFARTSYWYKIITNGAATLSSANKVLKLTKFRNWLTYLKSFSTTGPKNRAQMVSSHKNNNNLWFCRSFNCWNLSLSKSTKEKSSWMSVPTLKTIKLKSSINPKSPSSYLLSIILCFSVSMTAMIQWLKNL